MTGRIVVDGIDGNSQPVRYDYLLEIAYCHAFESVGDPFVVKHMLLIELGNKPVRPLYGAGHQLRKKSDIERKYAKMPFRFPFSPVNINGIA